jgi:hypothetical protein
MQAVHDHGDGPCYRWGRRRAVLRHLCIWDAGGPLSLRLVARLLLAVGVVFVAMLGGGGSVRGDARRCWLTSFLCCVMSGQCADLTFVSFLCVFFRLFACLFIF